VVDRLGDPDDPRSWYKPSARRGRCNERCMRLCSGYDAIVANTNEANMFVHDLFFCAGRKVLWWVHESNLADYQHLYRHQGALLRAVPGSVFVTQRSFENYRHLNLSHPVVISNSMDTSRVNRRVNLRDWYRRKLGFGPRDVVVLQIGTVSEHKNQLKTVRAMRKALERQQQQQQQQHGRVGGEGGTAADAGLLTGLRLNLIIVGNTHLNPAYEKEIFDEIAGTAGSASATATSGDAQGQGQGQGHDQVRGGKLRATTGAGRGSSSGSSSGAPPRTPQKPHEPPPPPPHRLSIAARVQVHDKTSDTAKYFEAADLYVLPSSRESFGLTLLEATMHGLPIVTSGADGIKDVFDRGTEFTVMAPDWANESAATFADALTDFAANPNDPARYAMVRRAQRRVRRRYRASEKMLDLVSEINRVAHGAGAAFEPKEQAPL
jgi:glycosyltransferase involved in cell wall biosynthesis